MLINKKITGCLLTPLMIFSMRGMEPLDQLLEEAAQTGRFEPMLPDLSAPASSSSSTSSTSDTLRVDAANSFSSASSASSMSNTLPQVPASSSSVGASSANTLTLRIPPTTQSTSPIYSPKSRSDLSPTSPLADSSSSSSFASYAEPSALTINYDSSTVTEFPAPTTKSLPSSPKKQPLLSNADINDILVQAPEDPAPITLRPLTSTFAQLPPSSLSSSSSSYSSSSSGWTPTSFSAASSSSSLSSTTSKNQYEKIDLAHLSERCMYGASCTLVTQEEFITFFKYLADKKTNAKKTSLTSLLIHLLFNNWSKISTQLCNDNTWIYNEATDSSSTHLFYHTPDEEALPHIYGWCKDTKNGACSLTIAAALHPSRYKGKIDDWRRDHEKVVVALFPQFLRKVAQHPGLSEVHQIELPAYDGLNYTDIFTGFKVREQQKKDQVLEIVTLVSSKKFKTVPQPIFTPQELPPEGLSSTKSAISTSSATSSSSTHQSIEARAAEQGSTAQDGKEGNERTPHKSFGKRSAPWFLVGSACVVGAAHYFKAPFHVRRGSEVAGVLCAANYLYQRRQ